MDIQDLVAGARTIAVPFGERAVSVTYNPQSVTVGLIDPKDTDPVQAARVLSAVLVDWDLTNRGVPVGTDVASLTATNAAVVGTVLSAILQDTTVDPPKAGN